MAKWLAAAVIILGSATAAQAQFKGVTVADIADVARTRALDLRVMQERAPGRPALLVDGMIARRGVAPNAFVGIGLARMYGRKKKGDTRISEPPVRRKPAVTFVLSF